MTEAGDGYPVCLSLANTRDGSRRFCFSNQCGNRARQAAFRHRQRAAPARARPRAG